MNKAMMLAAVMGLVLGSAAVAGTPQPPSEQTDQQASAADPNVPGATGRTIVLGNHSTIAGNAEATRFQQTGAISGGN
jgi:hypothetical protein